MNAVIRSLEVIGEATKNIPKKIRREYSEVPWRKMAGMRDTLIHEYFGIDKSTIWQTLKKDLPKILPLIEKVREGYEKEKGEF
jgi:hypothetical protein